MGRPKKETTEALGENESVTLEVTPEVLETMIQNRKENQKAVKLNEGDSIGKPKQVLGAVNPRIKDYELWVIDISMANRPSTNPSGRGGNEGYATGVSVIKFVRPIKTTEEGAKEMNDAVDWRQAGSPNHFVWCFPKGAVSKGQDLKCTCSWIPFMHNGNVINHNFKIEIHTNQN